MAGRKKQSKELEVTVPRAHRLGKVTVPKCQAGKARHQAEYTNASCLSSEELLALP